MRLDGYTYLQIAIHFGVSRQRTQQVLSPPPKIKKLIQERYNYKCRDCGLLVGLAGHIHHENSDMETYESDDNLYLLCISCHRKRHALHEHFCLQCGKRITRYTCCSKDCYRKYHTANLICPTCGKQFSLLKGILALQKKRSKSDKTFCSRQCKRKTS